MGTKYTTEAISGYNSSPPTDDGSNTEANKVKWSTHKTKLNDPIKDQVANIDTKLVTMADLGPDAKSGTYTTVAGDHQKTIECDGTFTVTLLAVASAPTGYTVTIKNEGSGTITVDGTSTETIDGSTSTIALIAQEVGVFQKNNASTGYSILTPQGTIDGRDIAVDGTKLDTIETSATADQTDAQIKTAYENNADTNEFSDAEQTKLAGIETGATQDQTNAQIKTAYEANADTNEFSDAEQTKLAGIETAADVTDTANVTSAGALMDSEVDADIKTLVLPASTTISAFGKTLVDDASDSAARTTLIAAKSGANTDITSLGDGTTATTQTAGDNTTKLATTAYVDTASSIGTGTRILVEDVTASSDATIDLTSDITSTYDNYEIVFDNVLPATNATQLQMLVSSNNGSSFLVASGYYFSRAELSEAAWVIAEGINGTSFGFTGVTVASSTTRGGINGVLRLHNPLPSAIHQFDVDLTYAGTTDAAKAIKLTAMGTYNATIIINAVRFKFSAGNIASGNIRIYGITK